MSRKRFRVSNAVGAVIILAALFTVGAVLNLAGLRLEKSAYPRKYCEYVEQYAAQNDLDAALVFAVIKTESGFRSDARSPAGALGLMQIMPATAEHLAMRMNEEVPDAEALLDAETNIRYGCEMLRWMYDEFGSVNTALAAYNGGWGNVREWLSDDDYSSDGVTLHTIPFTETDNFVRRVNIALEKYRELYYDGGNKYGD